jgi:hypothetical protein
LRTLAQPCFPSPREAAGRDQGWGVPQRIPLSQSSPIDPPPPTPPHHALTRAEGGEKKAEFNFQTALRILATSSARVLLSTSRPLFRGRRECRAPGAPAAARVVVVNTRVSHHGHTGNARHSPRNGFNSLFRALPGDRAFLSPSPLRSLLLKNLTPASRRQDHTTSPSASRAIRQRRIRVHRIPFQRP